MALKLLNDFPGEKNFFHHSVRWVFLTALFVFVFGGSLSVISIMTGGGRGAKEPVAVRLIFAASQEVSIKDPFDTAPKKAAPGQVIRSGTRVETGVESFAEIVLAKNVVRLDQNTTLILKENNGQPSEGVAVKEPRLFFELVAGSVWVSARDPVVISTPNAQADFTYAVGSYTYAAPLNRLMVVSGGVRLNLNKKDGEILADYWVPLRHQATFVDSQITDAYAVLKDSKLKKELKISATKADLLQDDWVRRNVDGDLKSSGNDRERIESSFAYKAKNGIHAFQALFSWRSAKKETLQLERIQAQLDYLMGGVLASKDMEKAAQTLQKLEVLAAPLAQKEILQALLKNEWELIGTPPADSPLFLIKKALQPYLLERGNTVVLRTTLNDAEAMLRQSNPQTALLYLEDWLVAWTPERQTKDPEEFGNQFYLLGALIKAYSDQAEAPMLAVFDRAGDFFVAVSDDAQEAAFSLMEERLDMGAALVQGFKYTLARPYTVLSSDAQKIMLQRAELLAERIAFAETHLRGAATPIEESEFRDYLQRKARDKTLSENLQSLLSVTDADYFESETPTKEQVVERFLSSRIVLETKDIETQGELLFNFAVKNARLMERAKDGSSIVISAVYDFRTNAVHDILVNEKPFRGNFELKDLVAVLAESNPEAETEVATESLNLFLGESEEAVRSELLGQALAVQLVLEELKRAGIQVVGASAIEILNPATLNEFRIKEGYIANPDPAKKELQISFDFDLGTKKISNISLADQAVSLPSSAAISDLIQTVHQNLNTTQERLEGFQKMIEALEAKGLLIARENIVQESIDRFRFTGLRVKAISPLEVSGVYSAGNDLFIEVSHPLLSEKNVRVNDYFGRLGPLFVIDYLAKKDIVIKPDQLFMNFPFSVIQVKNFVAGKSLLDFQINISASRLQNIAVQGEGATLDSMGYEEFKGVVKAFEEQAG